MSCPPLCSDLSQTSLLYLLRSSFSSHSPFYLSLLPIDAEIDGMAHLASIFDQQTTNGQHATAAASSSNHQDPRIALRQQDAQQNYQPRLSALKQINPHLVEAQLQAAATPIDDPEEEEEEDEEEEDDASSELSTTSGRRHGQLLQPEMEDWNILEVSLPHLRVPIGPMQQARRDDGEERQSVTLLSSTIVFAFVSNEFDQVACFFVSTRA